ncbi:MAG: hypothetical protein IJ141_02865 [Lachnospiraceae bacterium]|nr:hypothetical protein [Lachnospiraceae bacterium]
MSKSAGVYEAKKKNGMTYYRASITYRKKHISLGSSDSRETAQNIYTEAKNIIEDTSFTLEDYTDSMKLSYSKFISLINFRDNGIYFPTPIYLKKNYFEYYLSTDIVLKFDRDDLFFYASHQIQKRGGYLFVSDYGSQYKILGRYGIKPFAVYGRDYIMSNNDEYDYRYSNIKIINNYTGVLMEEIKGKPVYTAVIHKVGNHIIGRYETEEHAAIAYNKAVDILHENGINKNYTKNYIVSLSKEEYLNIYEKLTVSDKLYHIEK